LVESILAIWSSKRERSLSENRCPKSTKATFVLNTARKLNRVCPRSDQGSGGVKKGAALGCRAGRLRNESMIDAAECRRQAAEWVDQARREPSTEIRSALMCIARNWTSLADQMDRLQALRDQQLN
jgi:hypothetical protein